MDAPGYGYAKGGIDLDRLFGEMMESYFVNNNELKLVLILLDARREATPEDIEIVNYCKENNINYYLVITKTDKVNQKEKAALNKRLKEKGILFEQVYYTSALKSGSLDLLKKGIEKSL